MRHIYTRAVLGKLFLLFSAIGFLQFWHRYLDYPARCRSINWLVPFIEQLTSVYASLMRLDPEQFARVNRSAIVNVDASEELQPWTNGEYRIMLKDATELMWTRRFISASLHALLGS